MIEKKIYKGLKPSPKKGEVQGASTFNEACQTSAPPEEDSEENADKLERLSEMLKAASKRKLIGIDFEKAGEPVIFPFLLSHEKAICSDGGTDHSKKSLESFRRHQADIFCQGASTAALIEELSRRKGTVSVKRIFPDEMVSILTKRTAASAWKPLFDEDEIEGPLAVLYTID